MLKRGASSIKSSQSSTKEADAFIKTNWYVNGQSSSATQSTFFPSNWYCTPQSNFSLYVASTLLIRGVIPTFRLRLSVVASAALTSLCFHALISACFPLDLSAIRDDGEYSGCCLFPPRELCLFDTSSCLLLICILCVDLGQIAFKFYFIPPTPFCSRTPSTFMCSFVLDLTLIIIH